MEVRDGKDLEEILSGIKHARGGLNIQNLGNSLIALLQVSADERKRKLRQSETSRGEALVKDLDYNKKLMKDLNLENAELWEQLDNLKLVYSLRKGMSQEDTLCKNYEDQLDSMQCVIEERELKLKEMFDKNKLLTSALSKTKEERNMILEKYQKLEDRFGRDRSIQDLSRCSSFSQKQRLPILPPTSSRSSSIHSRNPSLS